MCGHMFLYTCSVWIKFIDKLKSTPGNVAGTLHGTPSVAYFDYHVYSQPNIAFAIFLSFALAFLM
jgi:hypothetical protein